MKHANRTLVLLSLLLIFTMGLGASGARADDIGKGFSNAAKESMAARFGMKFKDGLDALGSKIGHCMNTTCSSCKDACNSARLLSLDEHSGDIVKQNIRKAILLCRNSTNPNCFKEADESGRAAGMAQVSKDRAGFVERFGYIEQDHRYCLDVCYTY